MEGIKELDRLAKELVYQITGVEVKDTLSADYQIAYRYLEKVSKQSEQLKALEGLKEFAYDNCQPHNSDRLAEIVERL